LCNAIATGHEGDVEILRAVSNSLAQSGALSAPIAAMRRLLVEFVRLCRGVAVFGDNSGFGVVGGGVAANADANANVGGSMDAGAGAGTNHADGSVLPSDSVSMPVSPWARAGGSGSLGMGMEMGLAVSTSMEQQVDGMAAMARFDFMGHDDSVFSF
jgi:hypothetical protein